MAWGYRETTGATDFVAAAERQGSKGDAPLSVSQAVGAAKARVGEMPTLSVTGEVTGFRGPERALGPLLLPGEGRRGGHGRHRVARRLPVERRTAEGRPADSARR